LHAINLEPCLGTHVIDFLVAIAKRRYG